MQSFSNNRIYYTKKHQNGYHYNYRCSTFIIWSSTKFILGVRSKNLQTNPAEKCNTWKLREGRTRAFVLSRVNKREILLP